MLAFSTLPFALFLGILSAAPSTEASPARRASTSPTSASAGLAIPDACKTTCDSIPKLYSLDSCTSDSCTTYCTADGLDAYVNCSNCVLENASPALSKKDYRSIQAGLVHMIESCSDANAAAAPQVDLVDWYSLNSTTTTSSSAASAASSTVAASEDTTTSSAGLTAGRPAVVALAGISVGLAAFLW